jgi:hypothetical protein
MSSVTSLVLLEFTPYSLEKNSSSAVVAGYTGCKYFKLYLANLTQSALFLLELIHRNGLNFIIVKLQVP